MPRLALLLAILAAPLPALSQERGCGHEEAASCAQGSAWDAEAGACVPVTTS